MPILQVPQTIAIARESSSCPHIGQWPCSVTGLAFLEKAIVFHAREAAEVSRYGLGLDLYDVGKMMGGDRHSTHGAVRAEGATVRGAPAEWAGGLARCPRCHGDHLLVMPKGRYVIRALLNICKANAPRTVTEPILPHCLNATIFH